MTFFLVFFYILFDFIIVIIINIIYIVSICLYDIISYLLIIIVYFRQLLSDCGIGVTDTVAAAVAPAVNQHRALIFCQLKSMLDIVEYDLFQYVHCTKV